MKIKELLIGALAGLLGGYLLEKLLKNKKNYAGEGSEEALKEGEQMVQFTIINMSNATQQINLFDSYINYVNPNVSISPSMQTFNTYLPRQPMKVLSIQVQSQGTLISESEFLKYAEAVGLTESAASIPEPAPAPAPPAPAPPVPAPPAPAPPVPAPPVPAPPVAAPTVPAPTAPAPPVPAPPAPAPPVPAPPVPAPPVAAPTVPAPTAPAPTAPYEFSGRKKRFDLQDYSQSAQNLGNGFYVIKKDQNLQANQQFEKICTDASGNESIEYVTPSISPMQAQSGNTIVKPKKLILDGKCYLSYQVLPKQYLLITMTYIEYEIK